eukprot:SAG31_NODE_14014_length_831_cov_100.562842_1_plen_150_part_00
MPVRASWADSGIVARARTKGGLWRLDGARGDDRGHGGLVLVVGGLTGLLKRYVGFVCGRWALIGGQFLLFCRASELRAVLLQRRLLFEGDSSGRGAHAGVCACPSKGIDPSCLICCLCFALARSVLLLVAGAKTVVFSVTSELAAVKGQ